MTYDELSRLESMRDSWYAQAQKWLDMEATEVIFGGRGMAICVRELDELIQELKGVTE